MDEPLLLDAAWLEDCGLGDLDAQDAQTVLYRLRHELELRVGLRIAERLDDEQLRIITRFLVRGDHDAAGAWLKEHMPERSQIVRSEHAALSAEVRAEAVRILAAFAGSAVAS